MVLSFTERRNEMIQGFGDYKRETGPSAKKTYLALGNRKQRRKMEAAARRGRKAAQKVAARL